MASESCRSFHKLLFQAMAKRIGFTLLQILVTAAGLFYVFHDPGKRAQIGQALQTADWHWLVASWLVYGSVEAMATLRWQLLLRVQGIFIGWFRAGVIVMVGLFFNLFLPGLVGGDAIRLYLLFQRVPDKKARAILSVAMDRLLGLASLLLLALLVMAFRYPWLSRAQRVAHLAYLAVALLAGATMVAFVLLGFLSWRRGPLPRWLPLKRAVGQAGKALQLYRRNPGVVGTAFALTLLAHLAYYSSYYFVLLSLLLPTAREAGWLDFFSIMPLVNTITGVPISFGGVGIRETLFQALLGSLAAIPLALAALSASLGYAVQASWGAIGGLAYLFIRPRKGKKKQAKALVTE